MQWGTMLILIYMTEALVRISEPGWNQWLAILELIFSSTVFVTLLLYLKPLKAQAKLAKKMAEK
jgi:uncharacterized membrane protein